MGYISRNGGRRQAPGIETIYKGTRMRSRLEARWAAFFDELGWTWEYEPLDAHGYIPDFALLGDRPVLIEVKPASTLTELAAPLQRATRSVAGIWPHDVLAVGLTPLLSGSVLVLGLIDQEHPDGTRSQGPALWHSCLTCGVLAFHHEDQDHCSRLAGPGGPDHYLGPLTPEPIEAAWARATSQVRWIGPADDAPDEPAPRPGLCHCGLPVGPLGDHAADHTRLGRTIAAAGITPPPTGWTPRPREPRPRPLTVSELIQRQIDKQKRLRGER